MKVIIKSKAVISKLILISATIFSIILLTSCATTEQYKKNLNSWHGKNIDKFISHWGFPNKTMKMPNGNNVYIYSMDNVTHFPQYQTGGYTTVKTAGSTTTITQVPSVLTGGGTYRYKCITWVEFNKKGVIVNTSFRGNACVAQK